MNFVITGDGSKTLYHPEIGEHYHSKHGAVQESRHVFLKMGLQYFLAQQDTAIATPGAVNLLEVGFGTGLNFLLTADYCLTQGISLHYTGIEAFPLPLDVVKETAYDQVIAPELWHSFLSSYSGTLAYTQPVLPNISLRVLPQKVVEFSDRQRFDILYFDAFAAVHQPEMWTRETLAHICQYLKPGGVFVTYAITGDLKRSMKALGFQIEKAPGAPGKREMLRAVKL